MKKQIRKQAVRKIKSNSGASILIALLVFLIAAMTGSVILTSATVSSGAVNRSIEQAENLSSLKSAAQVLEDELKEPVLIKNGGNPGEISSSNLDLKTIQQYMGQFVEAKNEKCVYKIDSMTLKDSSVENSDKAKVVTGIMTMDLDYSIYIDLQVKGDKDKSHLYIRFNGDPVIPIYTTDENGNQVLSDDFNIAQTEGIITTVNVKEADDNGTGN